MKQKIFRDRKKNLREIIIKFDRLLVFIRHDSTEIWGFRYEITHGIGALKIIASTVFFVRIVRALKRSIKSFPCSPSMIFSPTHKRTEERGGIVKTGKAEYYH
jgi:hypothetical protein